MKLLLAQLPLYNQLPSKCRRQLVQAQPQPRRRQPEEIPAHVKAPPPKLLRQSFAVPQLERKIPRSVLVDDADHYYRSNENKQVKSENCEHVYDASSSRRLVIRVSLVLDANHLMPDFGKYLALALTSKISATS
jgi:hypothetical protein